MGQQQSGGGGSNAEKLEKSAREEFKKYAKVGRISKSDFALAIAFLEIYGFVRLGNTPLGDRLFDTFDTDRSGFIEESEYIKGIISLIENEEARLTYSFKCFDTDGDQKISQTEFVKMYEKSWMQAFKDLQDKVLSNPSTKNMPNSDKIIFWAEAQLPKLAAEVIKDFKSYTTTEYLDYRQFREWAKNTKFSHIEAQGPSCRIKLPVNLYCLS